MDVSVKPNRGVAYTKPTTDGQWGPTPDRQYRRDGEYRDGGYRPLRAGECQ